jgi:5-methyltetrahydrofolate--homocysteine methyltransferase
LKVVEIDLPMIVGGAALTRRFTHRKIAPAYGSFCTYARDAMHGLELVERLCDPERRGDLEEEVREVARADREAGEMRAAGAEATAARRSATVRSDIPTPPPPHLDRVVEELDLDEVWEHLNPQMLYGKHLGLKGSVRRLEARHDPKLAKLRQVVSALQRIAREGGMTARAVWRFYPARADGNRLILLEPEGDGVAASWELPRQRGRDGLCLSDYVLPEGDHVALMVTTAGEGVRERVDDWKDSGRFLDSHAFAALALETAEAAAELVHMRLREAWGYPDPEEMSEQDRFAARYRGKRYSFGYPACPDLSMQRELFAALRPEEIGVELTDGDMMEPEASVSALVIHHPDARYFGV